MYCQQCGSQNDDNAIVCAQCGSNMEKQKNKLDILSEKPHLLYAIVALLIGVFFVGSYSYFRYQDLTMKQLEQQKQEFEKLARETNLETQAKRIYKKRLSLRF